MSLLKSSLMQAQIWNAYRLLSSPGPAERSLAMTTLEKLAPASLPCLRFAIGSHGASLPRFSAAIVLHRLGEPQGIAVLTDMLRWNLSTDPTLAEPLEAAFIEIGSPDATTALLDVWWKITDWHTQNPIIQSICRVWVALRDPRALDGLVARGTRIPETFEQTVPAFKELALPALERMTRDADSANRALAIRTLKNIVGGRSFAVLVPLLKDRDPNVRALVPTALISTGGALEASRQVTNALQEGFSTAESVEMLARTGPTPYDTLRELIGRWNPATQTPPGDTEPAVMAALGIMEHAPRGHFTLAPTLCKLLERRPGPALTAETARILGLVAPTEPGQISMAKNALLPLLAIPHTNARRAAAESLTRLQEPLGRDLDQLLEECRPHGSLLSKFQTILFGGADAGQAANQAVQQVQQWVSKFSKETADRLTGGGLPATQSLPCDSRMASLLRDLLGNALDALSRATRPAENEALLTLCIAVLRALPRLGLPAALAAHDVLVRAFHTVKFGELNGPAKSDTFHANAVREIGQILRREAGEALLQIYRGDCFPLCIEALYHPAMEVKSTAIVTAGRLGDARALPHIAPYLADQNHLLRPVALEASNAIRRINPEMMTLLRASSHVGDARPETLLRPAAGNSATPADQLLRPSQQEYTSGA